MHAHLRPSLLVLTGLGVLLLSGCAKATVSATRPTAGNVARPDRVIVHDFAVTPRDVGLDRGLGPRAAREVSAGPQSEEEVRVGQAVARALSDKLVQNLRDHGINAARAGEKGSPGPTTASVTGEFLRIDQGDRTLRTMVGFGLGGSELRTRIHIYQGAGRSARLVAEGAAAAPRSPAKRSLRPSRPTPDVRPRPWPNGSATTTGARDGPGAKATRLVGRA